MSKRNFILLIIFLTLVVAITLLFLYFGRPKTPGVVDTGGTNFISNFNPFGSSKDVPPSTNPPVVNNEGGESTPSVDTSTLKLVKVSSMPIAGYAVYLKERYKNVPEATPAPIEPASTPSTTKSTSVTKKVAPTAPLTEFVPALRYVARTNGNIYQTFAENIEERKFSSTIVPKVYEAFFGTNGQSVIMRYIKNDRSIETFVGSLPKELLGGDTSDSNEIKGIFLPEDTSSLSISPDTLKTFYVFNSNANNAVGITSNSLGDKKVQVFDSPFTEWLTDWPSANIITLNTKPSSGVPGYLYAIDPNKKSFAKIFGDVYGLTSLMSPNGKLILYSDSGPSLNLYNTESREALSLNLKTLPEKCVWTKTNDFVYCSVPKNIPSGAYPDSWYKGEVSFSDELWKINVTNSNAELILDPVMALGGEEMDGIKLSLDSNGDYLFYVNKKDSYLWEVKLK